MGLTTLHDTEIFHNHLSELFRFYNVKVVTTVRTRTSAVSNSFFVSVQAHQRTLRTPPPLDRKEVRQTRQESIKIHTIVLSVRVNNRAQAALKRR